MKPTKFFWLLPAVLIGFGAVADDAAPVQIRSGHRVWSDEEIARGMAALEEKREVVLEDENRPQFHMLPVAGWMNDLNGAIEYRGHYHLFYLHNPYQDQAEGRRIVVWGHSRSKDLVHWERLPIALVPPVDRSRAMSGSSIVAPGGRPMIFFSHSVMGQPGITQWAAVGSRNLTRWDLPVENPVLTAESNDGPYFVIGDRNENPVHSWRDPYVFETEGRYFMLLGVVREERPLLAIYEADNDRLTGWTYRGEFFSDPDNEVEFFECPKFFRLEDCWVLVYSPNSGNLVEYAVGDFNFDDFRFRPTAKGIVDHSRRFYVAENFDLADGRRVLMGWIPGWNAEDNLGKDWNGLVSLPRQLSLASDGTLLQRPWPTLQTLRGKPTAVRDLRVSGNTSLGEHAGQLELAMAAESKPLTLKLRCDADGEAAVRIRYSGGRLFLNEQSAPISVQGDLDLRVFLDGGVVEVFAEQGRVCLSDLIDVAGAGKAIEVESGEPVLVKTLTTWPMRKIWDGAAAFSEN